MPAVLAQPGGRHRYLGGECELLIVGSYLGARFDEITRLGSQPAASRPPSSPFAPTEAAKRIIPDWGAEGNGVRSCFITRLSGS